MRVLCLGNNTEDTDYRTRELTDTICYGLISDLDGSSDRLIQNGWYHSSIYDIEYGRLVELANEFDSVIMLDQPKEQYSHPDAFYRTVRLVQSLPNGRFLDDSYVTEIDFFKTLVDTNKSFCIFPFIELLTNNGVDTAVCCRSNTPVTQLKKLENFQTDPHYQAIRNQMISGKLVPEHCSACYRTEQLGITSARQQETVEWANRLNLTSIEDLQTIKNPAYYEVRPSNICNLQCRMCNPSSSHLIAKEYKRINLISKFVDREFSDFSFINFENLCKLYVAGGEPTAMPKFYEFVDSCIINDKTDFEFVVNTNATKINSRFRKQLQRFSNMQFIISIDGVDRINHYIRWPSNWKTIIENVKYLASRHVVSFNVTVSIYNITNLYLLLEFFDKEFPGKLVHCQLATSDNDMLSALNFPGLTVDQLVPIRNLRCYKNDPLLASVIEGIISHYEQTNNVDIEKLRNIFNFNDKLDQSRNIKLIDYIPELEQARKLL